ncbi:hypothetical protein ACFL3S_07925, partial [Gemmatimonadota bacterium]
MPSPSLLQRLKERKLVQWALAYLAGAWVIYEVVDTVGDRWSLPDVFFQGFAVVLGIGFFVALVLAWYHGEKGRQRVSGPELLMVAALLVVAGVALSALRGSEGSPGPAYTREGDDRPTIAVLALDNLSPDSTHDFFAAGVQEDLTAKLQGISTLAVISRTSVEQYRDPGNRPSIREIAADLGADFLVEGSVRIGGDSVRITVQLIEGSTDLHLWSESFNEPYTTEAYYRLQAQIAQRIASDLMAAISPEELAWMEAIPTGSLEALEAYMRGNEAFYRERRMGWRQDGDPPSSILYEEAVTLDPGFAQAHARQALSLSFSGYTAGKHERVRTAAETALSLGGELPEARLALAQYYSEAGDREEAVRQTETAAAAAPDHPLIAVGLAEQQEAAGDLDAANQTLLSAEQLNPRDPFLLRALTGSLIRAHRFDDALDALAREAARSQTPPHQARTRAMIHLMQGQYELARAAITE